MCPGGVATEGIVRRATSRRSGPGRTDVEDGGRPVGWWAWGTRVVGVLLVLLVAEDIFLTVLFPGSERGVLRIPLSRGMWRLFQLAARTVPSRRGRLLSYSGPVLVAMNVALWVLLLAVGFAFIVWPVLGSAIQAAHGSTPRGFATALYYSGYAFTTLGTGDLVAKTALYRLLMVVESATGFATITLILTYFLSVYNALTHRNTFALSLHYCAAGTGDAAELVALLGPGGDFSGSKQDICGLGTCLLNVLEEHRSYPILRYFRLRQPYTSLPRLFLVTLDTAALLKSALHPAVYRTVVDSAATVQLWGGGLHVLHELAASFLPTGLSDRMPQPEQEWRERYHRARARLQQAGIQTTPDPEAGAERYVALRRAWDPYVRALASYTLYNWAEVDPAAEHVG